MKISDIVSLKFDTEKGCVDDLGRQWALYYSGSLNIQDIKSTMYDFETDNNGTYLNFKRSTDTEISDCTYLNTHGLNFDEFNLMKGMTIEFEIKDLVKKSYNQILFSFYRGQGDDSWGIGVDNNGILKLFQYSYNSSSISLSSIEITKSTWQKYTLMYDDKINTFYFYINGVLDKTTSLNGIANDLKTQLFRQYYNYNYTYSILYIGQNREWGTRSISSKAFSFKIKSFSMYNGLKYNKGSNIDLSKFCQLMDESNRNFYKEKNIITFSNVYSASKYPDENTTPTNNIDIDKYGLYWYLRNDIKFYKSNILMANNSSPSTVYSYKIINYDEDYFLMLIGSNSPLSSGFVSYNSSYYHSGRMDLYSNIYYGYRFKLPTERQDNISKMSFITFYNETINQHFYYTYDSATKTFKIYTESTTNAVLWNEIVSENGEFNLYISVIDNVLKWYINGTLLLEIKYLYSNNQSYFSLTTGTHTVKVNNTNYSACNGFLFKNVFCFRSLYSYDGLMTIEDYNRLINEAEILSTDMYLEKPVVGDKVGDISYKATKYDSKFILGREDNKFHIHEPFKIYGVVDETVYDINKNKIESVQIYPSYINYQKQHEHKHKWFIVGLGDKLDEDLYFINESNDVIKVFRKGQANDFGSYMYMDTINHKQLYYRYKKNVYPVPNYDMQRGYLDVEVDERSCKNPTFKIRCHEHDTGIMIGDYPLVDHPSGDSYIAYVPNLDMSKTYDITLIDTRGKIEYQVMSNRKPILIT